MTKISIAKTGKSGDFKNIEKNGWQQLDILPYSFLSVMWFVSYMNIINIIFQ